MKRIAALVLLAIGLVLAPAPAMAAGGGGESEAHHASFTGDEDSDGLPNWRDPSNGDHKNELYVVPSILQHAFNLALLIGIFVWLGKRPVADALANRATTIREEIDEAARMREEAREEHERLSQRLADFESEVQRMKDRAAKEAAAEEARLLERADEASERIAETAQRNIREELMRARVSLRREAVDLAVQLAERSLDSQVSAEDHRRLAREFLDTLGEDAHGGR